MARENASMKGRAAQRADRGFPARTIRRRPGAGRAPATLPGSTLAAGQPPDPATGSAVIHVTLAGEKIPRWLNLMAESRKWLRHTCNGSDSSATDMDQTAMCPL